MRRAKKSEEIKDIVGRVIEKIERQEPGRKEEILSVWNSVVGEKASLHSRPVGIKSKHITIEVDSSTWLYDLTLRKRSILKDINKLLEKHKIEDIRFKMGDIA